MTTAAKLCGVNLCQAIQTLKLIMTHGIQLNLFTLCFVNNVSIDKDDAVALKEKETTITFTYASSDQLGTNSKVDH